VLGIVENMSYFLCPHCGERTDVFGHGGAEHEAKRIGVPFLGAVPLHAAIRAHSDAGTPIVVSEPDGEHARIFREIAARTWAGVQAERASSARKPPAIVIEE
jgi:ATP-binding protein involved in chromosome partitioning